MIAAATRLNMSSFASNSDSQVVRSHSVCLLWLCLGVLVPFSLFGANSVRLASGVNHLGQTGSAGSYLPKFSADGQHIVFISQAKNLVTNDDQGTSFDVFIHDLTSSNTTLVSVNVSGIGGGNDHSLLPSLSSNGQFVAFTSAASNLAPGDDNRINDIFVRDVAGGVTRLVSANIDGTGSGNGASTAPLISEDGRFVIFESAASNLVTNDFNGTNDVFVHDLITGVTSLVSMNAGGTASGNGPSSQPSMSADGRFVAFVSMATNLTAGVTNRLSEVYVRDIVGGETMWASSYRPRLIEDAFPSQSAPKSYGFREPTLSRNGRYVAYTSFNSFYSPNGFAVFRRDLHEPPSETAWDFLNLVDHSLSLSDDGRYVVCSGALSDRPYWYRSTNTVVRLDAESSHTNYVYVSGQPFVFNGAIELVGPGEPIGGASAWTPAVTSEGNRIVFVSDATNLVPGTDKPQARLYLRDMAQTTMLLSDRLNRTMDTTLPAISRDGSLVAFDIADAGLVPYDYNRASDVAVKDMSSNELRLISQSRPERTATTGNALAGLSAQALDAGGRSIVFFSFDSVLVPDDTNDWSDAFARDLQTGIVTGVGGPLIAREVIAGVTNFVSSTNSAAAVSISANGRFVLVERTQGIGSSIRTNAYRSDLLSGDSGYLVRLYENLYAVEASEPSMSQDGRVVTFQTSEQPVFYFRPPRLDIGDANGNGLDIIALDFGDPFSTNSSPTQPAIQSQVVSLSLSGDRTGNRQSWRPLTSPNGRWVVFQSHATDLTTNEVLTGRVQLFARNLDARQTKLLTQGTSAGSSFGATNVVISGNSRHVFFRDTSNYTIYRHDLESEVPLPNRVVCTNCSNPSPSDNGQLVVYQLLRSGGAAHDVVLRDLGTGVEELVTVGSDGSTGANGPTDPPLLSYDGRFVVFTSKASNLVMNDHNNASDVFVRDRWLGVTFLASVNFHGTGSANGPSTKPVLSADGRTVAFQSFADDLVPGDFNDTRDVFVLTLSGPDTDGDGLEDDWEMAYFDTLDRNGSGDFDSDGQSDAIEERAGTDPTNGGSVFRVLTLHSVQQPSQSATNRTSTLLWRSAPGRAYRVQFKDSVTDTFWLNVPGDVTAASVTASKTHVRSTLPVDASRLFYRVVLLE